MSRVRTPMTGMVSETGVETCSASCGAGVCCWGPTGGSTGLTRATCRRNVSAVPGHQQPGRARPRHEQADTDRDNRGPASERQPRAALPASLVRLMSAGVLPACHE